LKRRQIEHFRRLTFTADFTICVDLRHRAQNCRLVSVVSMFSAQTLSPQIAIKQHLAAQLMDLRWRPQRFLHALYRRKIKARPTIADDDGRNHDVQPVETVGDQEA
jgi:hypothetical protein